MSMVKFIGIRNDFISNKLADFTFKEIDLCLRLIVSPGISGMGIVRVGENADRVNALDEGYDRVFFERIKSASIVDFDEQTGEVFYLDWFRANRIFNESRYNHLLDDVRSNRLVKLIMKRRKSDQASIVPDGVKLLPSNIFSMLDRFKLTKIGAIVYVNFFIRSSIVGVSNVVANDQLAYWLSVRGSDIASAKNSLICKKLIFEDKDTGEVYISDWSRMGSFSSVDPKFINESLSLIFSTTILDIARTSAISHGISVSVQPSH